MKLAKKMILAAAVLPLALGTTAALAYGGHGWDKEGDGHCGDRGERGIWKQLDLTAEQQAQLKEMREAGREEMRANRGQNHDAMKALHAQERALVLAADLTKQPLRIWQTDGGSASDSSRKNDGKTPPNDEHFDCRTES